MTPATGGGLQPENLAFLQQHVYTKSGIVLDGDKQYLMEARLWPLVRARGLASLNDLCAAMRVAGDGSLDRDVVEAMTTNETYFFREPAQFDALRTVLLPELVESRRDTRRLSFWSAASSSGQEAYSLAMLLLEMGLEGWTIQILGTDLNSRMLRQAESGRYSQLEVNRGLPAQLLVRYFRRVGLEWEIHERARRLVRFQSFDLRARMSGLGPFDLVLCRNVLIYFDLPTRQKIIAEVYGTLFRGGRLLLGGSETAATAGGFGRRSVGGTTVYVAG
jgi:chemotaxis protein methyltransferase CheR